MFEIPWLKYGNKEFRYQHGKYLFKWKITAAGDRYEIYENDVLRRNNLTYWDFLAKAEILMGKNQVPGDIWN